MKLKILCEATLFLRFIQLSSYESFKNFVYGSHHYTSTAIPIVPKVAQAVPPIPPSKWQWIIIYSIMIYQTHLKGTKLVLGILFKHDGFWKVFRPSTWHSSCQDPPSFLLHHKRSTRVPETGAEQFVFFLIFNYFYDFSVTGHHGLIICSIFETHPVLPPPKQRDASLSPPRDWNIFCFEN